MAEGGEESKKTLKDGERIVAPTRRPDGSLRKPIRIRAGYVPQEEVAIYQSKGALWKKGMEAVSLVPPGYDPVTAAKQKTKSAKRNERKKEKRQQQAALENNTSHGTVDGEEVIPTGDACPANESPTSLTYQMNDLAVSEISDATTCAVSIEDAAAAEAADSGSLSLVDKKIRALKKKIRQAEAQQQKVTTQDMNPEQLDKLEKLEGWRQELKLLECKNAENAAS